MTCFLMSGPLTAKPWQLTERAVMFEKTRYKTHLSFNLQQGITFNASPNISFSLGPMLLRQSHSNVRMNGLGIYFEFNYRF